MSYAKHIGRVGALAVALGVGHVRAIATRTAVSIGAAALMVTATVIPAPASTMSTVRLAADSTALIMGTTSIPTPNDYYIDAIKNQYIAPTHPGQDIEYVAVTTPQEAWPLTGIVRLLVLGLQQLDPLLATDKGLAWPDEPWWKLSGLFDLTWDQANEVGVADLEAAMTAAGNDNLVIYGYGQSVVVANLPLRKQNERDFFIHVAEKSVSRKGQLRHTQESAPIAGDATGAARLGLTRLCTTDESVMRNGH